MAWGLCIFLSLYNHIFLEALQGVLTRSCIDYEAPYPHPSIEFHSTTPTGSLSLTQKDMIWSRLPLNNDFTCILDLCFEVRRDTCSVVLRCILLLVLLERWREREIVNH